jgi:porin
MNTDPSTLNSLKRKPAPSRLAIWLALWLAASAGTAAQADEAPVADAAAPIVQPSLTITGEYWRTVDGGLRTGGLWNVLADLTLEVDLARLGGPADSALVAQVLGNKNQHEEVSVADYTGAANPVSGIHAGDAWRVFNLHYRQSWADGAHTLKLGQLAIDDEFMGSEYSGLFANSAFGAMPSQVATPLAGRYGGSGAFPIYAVASPGLLVQTTLNDAWSWQTGLYYGGPGLDEKDNHGFEWTDGAGLVVFTEAAWTGKLASLPNTVRLGGAYHSARFDDFESLAAGRDDATVRGLYSFYVVHDITLASRAEDKPLLGAFWRAGVSPQSDRAVVSTYADAGLNWFGPIPGRDDDIAGLAVACTHFGREFRRASGDEAPAGTETALELTYRAQLTPWWALQADAQWLFEPARDADSGRRETATVVGLRTEFAF